MNKLKQWIKSRSDRRLRKACVKKILKSANRSLPHEYLIRGADAVFKYITSGTLPPEDS
jgi:hypothetical protein